MLPIDIDVNVKIKDYHSTYYYQKGSEKFQRSKILITVLLFKGTNTLNGKTWLDGTIFLGHKKYIKRKKILCFNQKYLKIVGQRTYKNSKFKKKIKSHT